MAGCTSLRIEATLQIVLQVITQCLHIDVALSLQEHNGKYKVMIIFYILEDL